VAVLGEGQSFGELAILYNPVRSATIKTLEDTDLIVLNRKLFEKYIKVV
jgi:CRP-like cAMP-binding protein